MSDAQSPIGTAHSGTSHDPQFGSIGNGSIGGGYSSAHGYGSAADYASTDYRSTSHASTDFGSAGHASANGSTGANGHTNEPAVGDPGADNSYGAGRHAGVSASYSGPNPSGYGGSTPPAGPGHRPVDDGFSAPTSYTSRNSVQAPTIADHGWTGPAVRDDDRLATPPPVTPTGRRRAAALPRASERGLAGWIAVIVMIAICLLGALVDVARGAEVKSGFNVALVIGSIISVLIVRRSGLFSVVVAPPLVYFVASAIMLYERSGGLSNRSKLIDSAVNWLVYGFPAIAIATAAVLLIAGVRILIRR